MVNGKIKAPGDVDVFTFHCRAGEQVVAETYARRLNSPIDTWLKVTDAKGHQLAFNDDHEDKGAGLVTHCADSYLKFIAPADGAYYLYAGDSQGKGGPDFGYRLRISAPMPDFALRIVPSAINGRPGMTVPVTLYALRKDGFSGEVDFALKNAPAGFSLDGGRIQAGQESVRATLTFPQNQATSICPLNIEGRAVIGGREVAHIAAPADDMIQAFAYHHLVVASDLLATVSGAGYGREPIKVISAEPVKVTPGGTAQVKLSMGGRTPFAYGAAKSLQLNDPPAGISIGGLTPMEGGATVSIKVDPAKAKPGLKGNLLVEAFGEYSQPSKNGKGPEKKRWSAGFLPAIPFEVVAK